MLPSWLKAEAHGKQGKADRRLDQPREGSVMGMLLLSTVT